MFYVANKFVVSLDSITFAGKKTCFMKDFFIHHVFEIIIIVIAFANKIYDTIITWKQYGFKSTRTNLLLLFLMTIIVILLFYCMPQRCS